MPRFTAAGLRTNRILHRRGQLGPRFHSLFAQVARGNAGRGRYVRPHIPEDQAAPVGTVKVVVNHGQRDDTLTGQQVVTRTRPAIDKQCGGPRLGMYPVD